MRIIPVDCNYVEKEFAASFLLSSGGRGFFVECNTTHAIPYLEKVAHEEGLSPNDVQGLLITHVHLDHAGGTGAFLKTFPHAKVYAHPRAAKHLIDPSKLIASATAVYGEEKMKEWYGPIYPCDPERVVLMQDQDSFFFEGREMKTKHLRGHANHHLVMMEPETQTLFSGDSFGVAYPKLFQTKGDIILASTSPTDFDGEAALQAIDWILGQHPEQIALTHFGFLPKEKIEVCGQILRDQIQYSMELIAQIIREGIDVHEVQERLQQFLVRYFSERGVPLTQDDLRYLSIDLKVNAQGLHFAAHRVQASSGVSDRV